MAFMRQLTSQSGCCSALKTAAVWLWSACQHVWGICRFWLSLSATYMMPLGCSCALMVAQQHHHSHTELPKTSRTQHTQGPLLCLESAEGSDGPWSCGLWLKVWKRQQGVWSAFQCLWHYEGCKAEQNLFILLHLVTSEPVLRQVNWAAA